MEKINKIKLFIPTLTKAVSELETGLKSFFANSSVKTVTCPDLSKPPFSIAAPGISGNVKLVEAGGVKNLVPLPNREKKYDLKPISEAVGANKSLWIGAGAGPFYEIGQNAELIANIKFNGGDCRPTNGGFISKTVDISSNIRHVIEEHQSTRFGLMGDFHVSDGLCGQVIEVSAKGRIGSHDILTAVHSILSSKWNDACIGLGGVLMAKRGKTKIHVMPDFSSVQLNGDDDVNNWLKFFDVESPFVAAGVLITNGPSELDIRPIHFHGVSRDSREGGHYHIDTEPEEVEYLGYFTFGEELIRFDQPE